MHGQQLLHERNGLFAHLGLRHLLMVTALAALE
jgi:hypothetical protein